MKKALVIIDVQNDYFSEGAHELYEPDKALDMIQKLIHSFRKKNEGIYYIQQISDGSSNFFRPNTVGCQIHEKIKPQDNDKIIVKHYPSSFLGTTLHEELQKDEVDELVVCGMMTHMCVDTTVRVAKDYGYKMILISDGCATNDLEINGRKIEATVVQDTYLASLKHYFADIMTCEEFLEIQK